MKRFTLLLLVVTAAGLWACWQAAPRYQGGMLPRSVACAAEASAKNESPKMVVHFIDVGQGDAALLEFPCGVVLIDAGGDAKNGRKLVAYLAKFFSDRPNLNKTLKSAIVTHPHIDHTQMVKEIAEAFAVERWVMNGQHHGSGWYKVRWLVEGEKKDPHGRPVVLQEVLNDDIENLDANRKGKPDYKSGLASENIDPVKCARCDPIIRVLCGGRTDAPKGWKDTEFDNVNNHSMAVRVQFGKAMVLFTGDLETAGIKSLVEYYGDQSILDVDVYHVGHHGSRNGTTKELMDAMTPKVSVISMSRWDDNRPHTGWAYGHPHQDAVRLLEAGTIMARPAEVVEKVFLKGLNPDKPEEQRYVPMTIKKLSQNCGTPALGRGKDEKMHSRGRLCHKLARSEIVSKKQIYATGWGGDVRISVDLAGRLNAEEASAANN